MRIVNKKIIRIAFIFAFSLLLLVFLFRYPNYYIARWMAGSEMARVLKQRGLDPGKLGELKQINIQNTRWAFMADYEGPPPQRFGVRIDNDGSVEFFSERNED